MAINLDSRKIYRVLLDDEGIIIADKCRLAADFASRFKGLMFRDSLPDGEALLIVPCNSVHTFFMRFSIDVVFINQNGTAVEEQRNMEPGRMMNPVSHGWATLELKGGAIESLLGSSGSLSGRKIRFEEARTICTSKDNDSTG